METTRRAARFLLPLLVVFQLLAGHGAELTGAGRLAERKVEQVR
jgi:hypothetical protein